MNRLFEKHSILILILFGLIVRMLFYFFNQNALLLNDSQTYMDLAELISSGSIKGYFGGRSPGYSLLLVFLGNSIQLVVWFQILI